MNPGKLVRLPESTWGWENACWRVMRSVRDGTIVKVWRPSGRWRRLLGGTNVMIIACPVTEDPAAAVLVLLEGPTLLWCMAASLAEAEAYL